MLAPQLVSFYLIVIFDQQILYIAVFIVLLHPLST